MRACRADDIFKLGGNVYAFDSTTIELCLETFKWALYRKNQGKGVIKVSLWLGSKFSRGWPSFSTNFDFRLRDE